MKLYAALLEKRRLLKAEEDGLIAAIETAGGTQTDEQRARLKSIDGEFETLAADITAEERRRERERTAPSAVSIAADAVIEPVVASAEDKAPTPFRHFGEQLQAIKNSAIATRSGLAPDTRLVAIMDHAKVVAGPSGASEAVGADGGFLVQKDISNELLTGVWDTGLLSRRARHIPIGPNSNGIKINVIDETSRADGSRWGAVQAFWVAEGGSMTAARPKFKPLEMTLGKLVGLYYATDEELGDATVLESTATEAFTEEFGFKVDDAMIRGTGAGIPLGVLNAPCKVTIAKEAGQAAASLLAENFKKAYARMPARSMSSAAWFINQECWPEIFGLYQAVGTGGMPMFIPAGALADAPFGAILGRPIIPIEQASALGTEGDVVFADWNQYLLIEKGGIAAASSIHVLFLTDEMTFRWTLRTNGQPKPPKPITPFKGTATISPFITIATR